MVLGMAPSSAERRGIVQVPGVFYVNDHLKSLMFDELQQYVTKGGFGGFLPGMKQLANVAGLPGIVSVSRWLHVRLAGCVCACRSFTPVWPCASPPLFCAEIHCLARCALWVWVRHWQCRSLYVAGQLWVLVSWCW